MSALERDAELRGGRTARLLVAAGALGIFGAVGMIRLLSGHPYGHHPSSHVVVFSAVWSGLLVVALALVFLRVRTPSLPLARAACVGVLGLGITGVCSAFCPDQHFLEWWISTSAGGRLRELGGLPLSALCFGGVTTLAFGAAAAIAALGSRRLAPVRPLLPAGMLLLLLLPGVALQSVGTPPPVFVGWLAGTAIGAYAGVALGLAARQRLVRA
ncbi:MAG TPA: hypothetical protein VFT98_08270 [Myxococcota bacterium]|nr:hypothetical protein [Myxococcota bacterium]